jgi:hypothetical protein
MRKFDCTGNEISRWKWTGRKNSEHKMEILKFYDNSIGEWRTFPNDWTNSMLSYPFTYNDEKLLFDGGVLDDFYYKYFIKNNSLKIYETNHEYGKNFKRHFVKECKIDTDIELIGKWKNGDNETLEFINDITGEIFIKAKYWEARAKFNYCNERIKIELLGGVERFYDGYFKYSYSVENNIFYMTSYYRIEGNNLFLAESQSMNNDKINSITGDSVFEKNNL